MTDTSEKYNHAWLYRASMYELLALGFRLPTKELAEAVSSGEYADALRELGSLNGLDSKTCETSFQEINRHIGVDDDKLFHQLRSEYTRLFVGAPKPVVSPYAGIWWAVDVGVEPLLFVNKESMGVERFMRSCGIGQPAGTNEPLDSIASELEFLQYLCMLRAGAKLPPTLPDDFETPKQAYEDFVEQHFSKWRYQFAKAVIDESNTPFYKAIARVLLLYPY